MSPVSPSPSFQFRSSNLDEFRDVVGQLLRPFDLDPRAERYDARVRYDHISSLGFAQIEYGPEIDLTSEPMTDFYVFQTALAGSFRARCLGPELTFRPGALHIINPASPLRLRFGPGCKTLLLRLEKSQMAELLGADSDEALTLPESISLAGGDGASFRRCLEYLHAESMQPGSPLKHSALGRHAEEMLLSLVVSLLRRQRDVVPRFSIGPCAPQPLPDQAPPMLTGRELEIARLVAAGLNNREIADCLSISHNTIKEALKRIFRKVDVDSRAELVARLSGAQLL
jgi:DNA-binding CsgD family transcriptional regulator